MDKDSGVGAVRKSSRVRKVFFSVWKNPYHRNCNFLPEKNEIVNICEDNKINSIFTRDQFRIINFSVDGYKYSMTSAEQLPKINRKLDQPKKKKNCKIFVSKLS
jgi:hypothetical protein